MGSYPGIMTDRLQAKRYQLGDFLRAHRARLSPASLGLPTGGRRRTPGLRREEVAQACGMSATWYTWLEQGRDVSASPPALSAAPRPRQLAPAQRTHLVALPRRRHPNTPAPPHPGGLDAPPPPPPTGAALNRPPHNL